jgi:tetratricopeptide (TPR) repeat protein
MKGITRIVVGAALLALVFAGGAVAQQQNPPQQPPPTKAPPPPGQFGLPTAQTTPTEPAPPSPEEAAAYKAFTDLQAKKRADVDGLVRLGEDFVKKFPESRYNSAVYAALAAAYQSLGKEPEMFQAGEKSLELNPDQIDALALMAWVTPRRVNADDLALAQKLQKAEGYGKRCVEILEAMVKPEAMDETEFNNAKNEKLSMCHSGLGVVYLYTDRFADSAAELEKATTITLNPEPTDFFILGRAYDLLKRYHEAVAAYEKCSEKPSGVQPQCKQLLAAAKKQAATQLAPPKP